MLDCPKAGGYQKTRENTNSKNLIALWGRQLIILDAFGFFVRNSLKSSLCCSKIVNSITTAAQFLVEIFWRAASINPREVLVAFWTPDFALGFLHEGSRVGLEHSHHGLV